MSKVTEQREKLRLTQGELSKKSGISIRTIQRIESGQIPKGFTLKALAKALEVDESYLEENEIPEDENQHRLKWNKIVNLATLPFICFPPLNILIPLALILWKKQKNQVNKQLLSIQIIWTLIGIVLFIFVLILNDWFGVKSNVKKLIPILWIGVNGFIIIRNSLVLGRGDSNCILPRINML
ncbi:helix-turn-helix domain-containing protein [Chryseobacterium sediminis]|uniref:helix-turn-helix domain-containing protein n=1 Tax=Chryseobacterium sediminis TaxID=1679494 RepID=UPI00285A4AB1|nr:helix-turn-helix domain-containing protein [Chryseobacterium sediminis]MDR6464787.1 transcriptional regulator with XRE-family HTH domain [Chryseobacterium sediminis]